MQILDSLVSSILQADGDALVMHVGESPTIMTREGSTTLTSGALSLTAMADLLRDLLPPDAQHALEEIGAVEAELPPTPAARGERFTVVAARGGDDIWIEIRRARRSSDAPVSAGVEPASAGVADRRGTAAPPRTARKISPSRSVPRTSPVDTPVREPVTDTPAVVLPLARSAVRSGDAASSRPVSPRLEGLDRLLRLAAARGAEALYLFSQARPSIRVDGELSVLESEPVLAASDIEALLLEVVPDRRQAESEGTEWIVDVPDVGRVRCVSFRDHRGPGGVFRMIPARAISAEQLGLSREIQALSSEPEGLLLIVGPRSSGKSTLLAAFVDLINRSRGDHIITLENRIAVVHESRSALVSQREVRGDTEALLRALRASLRESPDVIVIEDLRGGDVVAEALEAAASGHLVIGTLSAHSAAAALERLVDQAPLDRRPQIQALLAESLRGVVAQVLLRKTGGGRIAARELLLNSSSVVQLISDGKFSQLPVAMESGRRIGMVPLTDALVAFVQSGVVDVREAWRKAPDRQALLKSLKREGIDTSFAERLA
ncbi:MAG TPA: ATPase, T2SS/T4P/T4SS family [Vicinamibacterales bacterium]|nr:ATPase, T2SS/T4P/T4SS family [Vicinamibacterales bacterium]